MLKKFILTNILLFSFIPFASSGGWKQLHEDADSLTIEQAQAAVKRNSQSYDTVYTLGLVYLNKHKNKEANQSFALILKRDPKNTEARWGMAEVLRRDHRLLESEKALHEVINDNPQFWPAYISLAYIKYLNMLFDDAVRLAYTVVKQGRENVDLSNFVRAHGLVGGAKGMIAHYGGPLSKVINGRSVMPYLQKAQQLQPDSPTVAFGLGSYYLLVPAIFGRDFNKAKSYLNKAIDEDPLFADAYVRLAQVNQAEGNQEKFEFYLKKALAIDPQNELALDIQSGSCKFICIDKNK